MMMRCGMRAGGFTKVESPEVRDNSVETLRRARDFDACISVFSFVLNGL